MEDWGAAIDSYDAALGGFGDNEVLRFPCEASRAVCMARLGRTEEAGRRLAQTAAACSRQQSPGLRTLAARYHLEAAVCHMHAANPQRAARALYNCFSLLGPVDHGSTLWANVAVLSRQLTSKEEWRELPSPGFTNGMSEREPEAEKMVPAATPLTLAMLASSLGSPHRALRYFELAERLGMVGPTSSVSFFKFEPLLSTGDLPAAAACLTDMFSDDAAQMMPLGVASSLISRLVQAHLGETVATTDSVVIERTCSLLTREDDASTHDASLRAAMAAVRDRVRETDDGFVTAWEEAIRSRYLELAANLCHIWYRWRTPTAQLSAEEAVAWLVRLLFAVDLAVDQADGGFVPGAVKVAKEIWGEGGQRVA